MNDKLDRVVTKDMFQAESRRVDDRIADVAKDIADERVAREKAINEERAAREKAVEAEKRARKALEEAAQARSDRLGVWLRWLAGGLVASIGTAIFTRFSGGM
ncbi:hypothetical protein [Isoptericola sp. QY 916]|uniref:hypothetical protein n=1 Tax=Isoptericola sp. QY 916 TaxID=2782570 RepID=UPI003D300CEA|nr:hypothetical protein [Isoptericola sp. QY 916]